MFRTNGRNRAIRPVYDFSLRGTCFLAPDNSAVRCVFTEIICQKASGRPPLREGSVFCVTEFAVLCMIFIPLSLTVPPISGFVAFAALYIMYIFTHRRELTLLRAMQR